MFSVFARLNILPCRSSVSVSQEGNPGKPQIDPVSAPSPASAPSRSRTATEPRRAPQLSPDKPRRTRQGQRRRTFSCSPQRRVSQTEQTRADSGTSEFGLESDSCESPSSVINWIVANIVALLFSYYVITPIHSSVLLHCIFNSLCSSASAAHTASADRQNDQYTESVNSLYNSSPSSSPVARNHHSDSLKALSSSQVASRK